MLIPIIDNIFVDPCYHGSRVVVTELSFEHVPREISDKELANWLVKQPEKIIYKLKSPSVNKPINENDKPKQINQQFFTSPSNKANGNDYSGGFEFQGLKNLMGFGALLHLG